jgi:hypothetical protein
MSAAYATVGTVIALLIWLHLGAQMTLYAAELNVVLERGLWPRSLMGPPVLPADQRTLDGLAKINESYESQHIETTFDPPEQSAVPAPPGGHGQNRHVRTVITAAPPDVYEFAAEPTNLPRWASGLAGTEVTHDGDRWWTDSPMGRVSFKFAPHNDLGVLDHDVTLPDGSVTHNQARVLFHPEGAEVVFTIKQQPGMSDAAVESDAETVAGDLARLKGLMERAE